ncbi:MAG: hypothetical protein ABSH51_16710 [Solirubrobacteraceae bacterium]
MRLLTKAIRALPERDEALVLAFLLDRALVAPAAASERGRGGEALSSFMVDPGAVAGRAQGQMRWPRTGALLLLRQAAADVAPAQLATDLGLEPEILMAIFNDLSTRVGDSQRLGAVFGELAQGHTVSEAADRLGTAVVDLAEELSPSEALVGVVSSVMMSRIALPRPPAPYLGYSPRGPLRTMPLRLHEEHYQRLKDWSDAHNFPMAVVVRGLVERFLDSQKVNPA